MNPVAAEEQPRRALRLDARGDGERDHRADSDESASRGGEEDEAPSRRVDELLGVLGERDHDFPWEPSNLAFGRGIGRIHLTRQSTAGSRLRARSSAWRFGGVARTESPSAQRSPPAGVARGEASRGPSVNVI